MDKHKITEIKPCPFCGSQVDIGIHTNSIFGSYFVFCNNCDSTGPIQTTESSAVSAWNKRASHG
ncbi:Lar family restriction alleviation protein [Providencia sp. PROV247]|uniref:Lar family restriction alleviation protein n=1 Tax=Providencia sp. PROV247 TaxID=2949938 RepID=UPI002348FF90|nr:Lar family restriction alleviation protein [Providencia sp. PROV247]